jgi:hypothetical protein
MLNNPIFRQLIATQFQLIVDTEDMECLIQEEQKQLRADLEAAKKSKDRFDILYKKAVDACHSANDRHFDARQELLGRKEENRRLIGDFE